MLLLCQVIKVISSQSFRQLDHLQSSLPGIPFRQAQLLAKMRPDFATKQFYLLGEDVSTAREIDVPTTIDEDELRQLFASHFAIVAAKGTYSDTALIVWLLLTDCKPQALDL